MWENFKEERTTDLARFFIGKSENLTIPHIKLLKLMYLADRESLKMFEHSITGDRYVSMRLGPVLSKTYGLIKGYDEDEYKDRLFSSDSVESVWYTYIQKRENMNYTYHQKRQNFLSITSLRNNIKLQKTSKAHLVTSRHLNLLNGFMIIVRNGRILREKVRRGGLLLILI